MAAFDGRQICLGQQHTFFTFSWSDWASVLGWGSSGWVSRDMMAVLISHYFYKLDWCWVICWLYDCSCSIHFQCLAKSVIVYIAISTFGFGPTLQVGIVPGQWSTLVQNPQHALSVYFRIFQTIVCCFTGIASVLGPHVVVWCAVPACRISITCAILRCMCWGG